MKKFVVDRVEVMETEEGMKYWGIFDENNNNWYEEQKNFKENTLKIMYNKDSFLILGREKDVSKIAPTMVGDIIEEIEYSEEIKVNPNLYFINGEMVELKECETIKSGKVVYDRDFKIEKIKEKLKELKEEKIKLGVRIRNGVYQPIRDTDRVLLMMIKETITKEKEWKYYDEERNPVLDKITKEIIGEIFVKGEKVLNGVIIGEAKAEEALENLTNEELKNLDIKIYFEKYYRENGGI
ncbi:hypothetical protein HMPREF1984_00085 [Leptotrichia sp. oral taxon 215 str. W9775]|jgi:hypothetical protein|uniref:hypothetical protein n=1 Tax=Leptotrichia sp. oral taxon 215 TaxID=712359 RepID=UPI0003ADD515|nr:hypothetical protein [Leptotrichia sp. oral taxon 215]ERK69034.1 hypothetical protein HMPREF1984_00085 [Leptotrichia sp. oral taxon 215 str. W9775]DAM32193.1 MAG TPA: tail fiber assembly protein [Caudoviricetes sp.]DAO39441.1 MAG TPA: tail fiber assembly protein [Caudoviricetes sp.]